MISKQTAYILLLHMASLVCGLLFLVTIESRKIHILYVLIISAVLVLTVFYKKQGLVRPVSYFVLSFYVFVWMRYVLNILFDIPVVSVGERINDQNVNFVALYLGIAANIICICALITKDCMDNRKSLLFENHSRVILPYNIQVMLVMGAFFFFGLFLWDSIKKIGIVNSSDYLSVSETLLTQGYRYFSMGKYFLLLWVIFGTDSNRYFKASTILMLAGSGYLMRGARGYAMMYIFMWLLFFSFRKRIHVVPLMALALALVFLANFILSYRLGWSVASGFKNIIISTLNSQGSSVESVFGSVIFHDDICKQFHTLELFTRNDYGIVVDQIRKTNFEMGGFGSSFFGEIYLGGKFFALFFLMSVGICIGILEYAYQYIKKNKNDNDYSQLLLFMTIPNLIYLGRSSIKDFIFKTLATLIIIVILQNCSSHKCEHTYMTNVEGGNNGG